MNMAYLIQKKHFNIQEVNFSKLKKDTNNIILEYTYLDNKYFRRSLFELDRLGFNIGIYIPKMPKGSSIMSDLINNLKGFKINLGIWIDSYNGVNLFNKLDIFNKKYFIIGVIPTNDSIDLNRYPVWKNNGDIEDIDTVAIDNELISVLRLNTDYATIYNENKFRNIPSNISY